MPLFASDRERRLWMWTSAAVVAIYSTLGLSGALAGVIHNQALAAAGFLLCMALAAATVLTQALRFRPRGVEIAVVLGIAVVYTMVLLRMTLAERSHLIEYSVVGVFIHEAMTERRSHGRPVPVPALLAILTTATLGGVDELIQVFLPNRVFDPVDIVFNSLAATMAVLASMALAWARRRFPGGGAHGGS